jgi:hypothetical protein
MSINYTDFDWRIGGCGTCSQEGRRRKDFFRNLKKYTSIDPIYVPQANYIKGEMFDMRSAFNDYSKSWGMNFRMSIECDLSHFICSHKQHFVQSLGLKVAWDILNDIKFSQQINYVEEQLKMMIIRDLEGDKETNAINLHDKLKAAIEAIQFDFSKVSMHCLPCKDTQGVRSRVL